MANAAGDLRILWCALSVSISGVGAVRAMDLIFSCALMAGASAKPAGKF